MRGFRAFAAGALIGVSTPQPAAPASGARPVPVSTCVPQEMLPSPTSVAPHSNVISDAPPPERFQNSRVCVRVQFETPETVQRLCIAGGSAAPPPGYVIFGCYLDDRADSAKIVMPNPCLYPDADPYAHLLCHEMAHVNGWPATHGD